MPHIFLRLLLIACPLLFSRPTIGAGTEGGKIVFTLGANDGTTQVRFQNVDGTESTVAAAGQYLWAGNWSHDGREVVINRQIQGKGRVFRLDTSSQTEIELAEGGAHWYAPVWSPDGRYIAVAEESLGRSRLLLLDAIAGRQSLLYDGLAVFNAWSPDASHAIITIAGQPMLVDIATGYAAVLEIAGFADASIDITDWNGGQIAFTHVDGGAETIYIAGIDGSNPRRAVQDSANHRLLKWSRDGTRFVFVSERYSTNGDVYLADAAGSVLNRVVETGDSNRILSLAYWAPIETRSIPMTDLASFEFGPLSEMPNALAPVDAADPISVAQRALHLMLSGTLADEQSIVCPTFQDAYVALSEAIFADFAAPDLAGVAFTLVEQHADWAQVDLSGSMSLLSATSRTFFPASLIPSWSNPIQRLYLVYDSGWKICTPL